MALKLPSLRTWNIIAFVVHLIVFVSVFGITVARWNNSLLVELTVDWRNYDPSPPGPAEAGPFSTQIYSLGFYRLLPVILVFPFLTSLVHASIAFFFYREYTGMVKAQNNWIRWLEYSVTASVMTWVLMQLCGITNIFLLVCLGVLGNVAMQLQGHLMEVVNARPSGSVALPQTGRRSPKPVIVSWVPTVCGWLIFLAQWIPLFSYFLSGVLSSNEEVPWFVYASFIGQFFNYASFGLLQFLYFKGVFFKTYQAAEYGYVFLSLFAKTYLALILAIGIAVRG